MKRFTRILLAASLFAAISMSAQAFDLKDSTGKPQKLADLKGKWVVVNFWATWCAPCVKEIPDIAAFANEQCDKARVLGIALDWDSEKQVTAFAKKVGLSYVLVLGDDKTEKTFGKIKGMPTTIVYDPTGKIAYQKTGTVTKELLSRIVAGEKV